MKKYSLKELAYMIDHTNLKADANHNDMEKLCQEANEYGFKMVAINQVQSKICATYLKDSSVDIGAAIAFPLGQTSIECKVFETRDAILNGATEIDYVINITQLKEKNYQFIKDEMQQIVNICKEKKVTSKVIFENAYLSKAEIVQLSEIARDVKPDFIKTSTGMALTGALVEDIILMKESVGSDVNVKASGGIRDAATFKAMIKAGATRIGTSSGIKIIKEIEAEMKQSNRDYIEI